MRRFKIRPAKTPSARNSLVLALASFVLVVPMLTLPLGLHPLQSAQTVSSIEPSQVVAAGPVASQRLASQPTSELASEPALEPTALSTRDIDLVDVSLNRSQSELTLSARAESAEGRLEAAMDAATEPVLIEVDYQVYISADVLNVRTDATTVGEIVAKITRGDRVQVIGELGDWLQIEADDQVGFIKQEFTSTDMVFRPVDETLYVKGTSLNVRATYGTEGELVAKLETGDKVHRTGIGDEWSRIELADGQTGYVASTYLTKKSPAAAAKATASSSDVSEDQAAGGNAPANGAGNSIVDLAYQAIGTPYVYGSESLKGMDCSGLVNWAYNQVGISVPRSSASFASAGEGVSLDNAEPGDVLCIDARPRDGRSRITHVAIYIGNGQVIHASTSQRKVVESSIASFYDVGYKILTVRRFPN